MRGGNDVNTIKIDDAGTELLTVEQERALAREAARGSEAAFERLVRAHLRLVVRISREVGGPGPLSEDLVSEGMLGLVEATRRFDVTRGVRLAAYAAFWIRAYIRRYALSNRRVVRPPSSRNARMLLAHLAPTQRRLAQKLGQRPDDDMVAAALAVSREEVAEMTAALGGRDVPYAVQIGEGRASFELSSDAPSPEAMVADHEERMSRRQALQRAMATLSGRERKVLRRRVLRPEPVTLAEVGRELGVSRERARQLESAAQEKLRGALLRAS